MSVADIFKGENEIIYYLIKLIENINNIADILNIFVLGNEE
jgi:hypothetical protein